MIVNKWINAVTKITASQAYFLFFFKKINTVLVYKSVEYPYIYIYREREREREGERKFRKILVENTTIIAHEIDKLWLQILEALHIKQKKLKLIESILKITMSWNAFSIFFLIFRIPW